jgi:DNA-binding transcriptional regulator GbsR (MarR family)
MKNLNAAEGNGHAGFKPALSKGKKEMVEATGTLFQLFGLPRSTGQIYGLLYISKTPLSLDDVTELLSISKGSASMGTRHLAGWGAIRQVWVQGDRKDFFEASDDFGTILRGGYTEFLKPRLSASEKRLEKILDEFLEDEKRGEITRAEYEFCMERLKKLGKLQKRLQRFGPLAEKFLE